jgi:hypothetical protein
VQNYPLKDQVGAIRPETRDVIKKLACQGVSTERISEVIKIVADGLGIQVVGSVSARSVARIMLEGLVEARMQVAHELAETSCKSFFLKSGRIYSLIYCSQHGPFVATVQQSKTSSMRRSRSTCGSLYIRTVPLIAMSLKQICAHPFSELLAYIKL